MLVQNSRPDVRRPTYSLSIAATDGQRSISRMPFLVFRYGWMMPRLAFCATVSVRKSEEDVLVDLEPQRFPGPEGTAAGE